MVEVGKVLSTKLATNIDGTSTVRLLQVELSSPDDLQTVQLCAGIDQVPLAESTVLILDVGTTWKLAIPLEDGVTPTALDGEKYLYSLASAGTPIAWVKLAIDGTVTLESPLATVDLLPDGSVSIAGPVGSIEMTAVGVVTINGNLEVLP